MKSMTAAFLLHSAYSVLLVQLSLQNWANALLYIDLFLWTWIVGAFSTVNRHAMWFVTLFFQTWRRPLLRSERFAVLFIICAVISNKHNYSMCFNTELLCSVLKLTPILNLACAYFFKYVANMVVLNHDPVPPENSVESYSRRTR